MQTLKNHNAKLQLELQESRKEVNASFAEVLRLLAEGGCARAHICTASRTCGDADMWAENSRALRVRRR